MTKPTTNQLQSIDILKHGNLDGAKVVEITINDYRQRLNVTTTPCNYGKVRYWFECPYCKGRCAIVYHGGSGLACRKCYGLAYPVENKTRSDRAIEKAWEINNRLKFECSIDYVGDKPKGMHWKTFSKLVAKRDRYKRVFFSHIGVWIERKFKVECSAFYR